MPPSPPRSIGRKGLRQQTPICLHIMRSTYLRPARLFGLTSSTRQNGPSGTNSKDVKVVNSSSGLLTEGARFDWQTFGLNVVSRVNEFVVNARLGWFGDAPNLKAYHTWFLGQRGGACHVMNEEVVKGAAAIDLRKSDPDAMHKGHDLWNAVLKDVSEHKP